MTSPVVRRVALHEWREVRDLRIQAVGDENAAIAFTTTRDEELARDDAFWRGRTAGAAMGDNAAQFVAIVGDAWVGSASVLLRAADAPAAGALRADVVGVYVAPVHRGAGILGLLFDEAAAWARAQGCDALTLSTHLDNARARAAYRKAGFTPTGVTFTSSVGPELEMRRAIA
ncbi:GNAT family N-acetyltransferase [Microbacterium sp. W1N]|uniref:GNAT family N-acetyltransferase n=1 Tax=Microbacterium festucae TaxID=2977531 RepID=UPI0021C08BAD|nr:GNAT family N-acetyltransferase [Microbacterium festucae]MCT9820122.1 GNAT family N-acetyltransferase [Microbacterium festucae]